ncbi:hypothetical protein FIBSPDRAFT_894130 [Athelia psychrophila]|uniref:DUF6570 domain-containing protein n=1 Tax=Athelia psychrophila TaxID=1759441 RepID=A0A166G7L5_9AGAM|nr:hypothetical protein FIBSPDRAFT_894130 [Fibularhizoctonia sp. CBS 109695]
MNREYGGTWWRATRDRVVGHAVQRQVQMAAAAETLAAQMELDNQVPPPMPMPMPEPAAAPEEGADPMSAPAISADDKILLENCRQKLMDISMETCNLCHEKWFDLNLNSAGKCTKCAKSTKFMDSNAMYPGPDPDHLPPLTQMEEMLISPVHALVQLWQIRGGQTKYTGHICNFPRENAIFLSKVPILPEDCDIIIMRRAGQNPQNDEQVYQDFRTTDS